MAERDPIDEAIDEAAELLREKRLSACGWDYLDDVQKADAIETCTREVERYAMSNVEGRPISREEYDRIAPRGDDE
jgi:hypothetical protein